MNKSVPQIDLQTPVSQGRILVQSPGGEIGRRRGLKIPRRKV